MRRPWLWLAMLAFLAGCAAAEPPAGRISRGPQAAEPAWAAAMLMLPGQTAPRRLVEALPELARARPMGVIVYAHGCRGFDAEAIETMRLLAASGHAVVAPDHHARPEAGGFCRAAPRQPLGLLRPTRRDPGLQRPLPADLPEPPDPFYVQSRIEEVDLALARLRRLPWADPARLYLVGESLGRDTVGLWPTRGLAGAAVIGQDCRRAGDLAGREMPLIVPVMPLGGAGAEAIRARHCAELAGLPETGLVVGLGLREEMRRRETGRALLELLAGPMRRT